MYAIAGTRAAVLGTVDESPTPASTARHFVRDQLRVWAAPEHAVSRAELMTSELVANAVEHGYGVTSLTVELTTVRLRIEVSDRSMERPRVMTPAPLEEGHRGLLIVDVLASRWGTAADDGVAGKTIWVELDLTDARR